MAMRRKQPGGRGGRFARLASSTAIPLRGLRCAWKRGRPPASRRSSATSSRWCAPPTTPAARPALSLAPSLDPSLPRPPAGAQPYGPRALSRRGVWTGASVDGVHGPTGGPLQRPRP
eukprot:7353089-Alexandrium_andersonii.AAC.1